MAVLTRTAYAYTSERLDVDEDGVALVLNPDLQYTFVHSGYKVDGSASTAVIDVRENESDVTDIPSYSPYTASEKAYELSPGGPALVVGPLGSGVNSNVTLRADAGAEAMILMSVVQLPPRF